MVSHGVVAQVTQVAEPIAASLGYELVEITFRREPSGWVLRFLLDRPGGVTLGDCERFSQAISPILDREDPIPYAYTLEVSSAGIERPLHKEADYVRFAGQPAQIQLLAPVNGRRHWRGMLAGVTPDHQVQVKLEEDDGLVQFPLESISKAHLLDPLLNPVSGRNQEPRRRPPRRKGS